MNTSLAHVTNNLLHIKDPVELYAYMVSYRTSLRLNLLELEQQKTEQTNLVAKGNRILTKNKDNLDPEDIAIWEGSVSCAKASLEILKVSLMETSMVLDAVNANLSLLGKHYNLSEEKILSIQIDGINEYFRKCLGITLNAEH